jgi:hypothetical protein
VRRSAGAIHVDIGFTQPVIKVQDNLTVATAVYAFAYSKYRLIADIQRHNHIAGACGRRGGKSNHESCRGDEPLHVVPLSLARAREVERKLTLRSPLPHTTASATSMTAAAERHLTGLRRLFHDPNGLCVGDL